MIRSVHINSCLAAKKRFLLFKGPGSFKIFFKIGGNVEHLKAYRLIPLIPPLLFRFTVALIFMPNYLRKSTNFKIEAKKILIFVYL
jgi:hypothetical protein